ncbi:glycosyltransferase family 2 protein [Rhodococcus globerulus]|uniref:glycosyltransferase family 2 protein n=1 Tax=Rhodococcus globerulus TaxID=33008 RepID=UPI001C59330A|nr:glycosyltransferase family 2 protein [Rhodococcus globerulus]QXW01378.1 glycosyltransferase family 2 protein [Rhodococcus globerulus]
MIAIVVLSIVMFGVNAVFWSAVGGMRRIEQFRQERIAGPSGGQVAGRGARSAERLTPDDVAILIAAHNEELVVELTIASACSLVPASNVHVVSDGSSDRTADLARSDGARVLELQPNVGKAGALAAAIEHFGLSEKYAVVLLLDADTRLSADYLETGLPYFDDPDVVAVAGRAATNVDPTPATRLGRILVAYRERVYVAMQLLIKYGQAAKRANVVSIVPGFASMYRTNILSRIDIDAPGLVIEDFNMTFDVHAQQLGRIAFHPSAAVAYTQDPDSFREYTNQVRRWTLGFWQTVRRHRVRADKFWLALSFYIAELIISSVVLLLFVPLLVVSLAAAAAARWMPAPPEPLVEFANTLPPLYLVLGLLIPDLILTVLAVVTMKRPRYLLYAPIFPLIRIVDSYLCLRSLAQSRAGGSSGRWTSPTRRAVVDGRASYPEELV